MIKCIKKICVSTYVITLCSIGCVIIRCKQTRARMQRKRFLANHSDYQDMYSVEGRQRISEYKFKTDVKDEQVACNIMLLSEPIKYISDLKLEQHDVDRIMISLKKVKETIKVA